MITIAIDGPSGSGKSTVAKKIAKLLNIYHVNVGELYRAIGVYLYEHNINARSEEEVSKVLDDININVEFLNNEQINLVNGEGVNHKLHTPIASDYSSQCSPLKIVREKVKKIQQDIASKYSIVMEGRDITTEVLPNAKYKFFITASPENRAKRRLEELVAKGINSTYDEVYADIVERDYRDTHRELSPLKLAADAIYIDTDKYSADEVVAIIYSKIEEV